MRKEEFAHQITQPWTGFDGLWSWVFKAAKSHARWWG